MAEYNNIITPEGITRVEITGEELTKLEADRKAFADKSADRKLIQIKEIRLEKLKETDWWVLRGSITDEQKEYRQKLRDIPSDYDSSKYDELLARDEQGQLTHTVWSKP
tara:strand:+ start:1715 stop:2041 length:327 start_codon:yes stop_codon:yes gene_type:complete